MFLDNNYIKSSLEIIQARLNKKYPEISFVDEFLFFETKKCIYYLKQKNKTCNKKIHCHQNDYCKKHKEIVEMKKNMIHKNDNINDFSLRIFKNEDKEYLIDVFDNIYLSKANKLEMVGVLDDDGEMGFF